MSQTAKEEVKIAIIAIVETTGRVREATNQAIITRVGVATHLLERESKATELKLSN